MADDSQFHNSSECKIVSRKEAIILGLKWYFTGKACKRGHVCDRQVTDRNCRECKTDHSRGYNKRTYHKDVVVSRKRSKEYRKAHPEAFRKYARRAYLKQRNKHLERARSRYLANPEKSHKQSKEWCERNLAKRRLIARKWAENNKETMRAWREANPDRIRVYVAASKSRRRSRIKENGGTFTKADVDRIFKAQKGKCAYCRKSLKDGYHIDHIVALANGGSNRPSNLQLTCEDCNHRKNARDPIEYAQSTGLLL